MLDVKQTLKDAEERMESAILYLDEELAHIRAGRANVAILDAVRVDSYGSKVPLNQVATVSTPDARTIADYVTVTPEDYVVVMTSGHGFDFTVQEQVLRGETAYIGVIGSRRKELVKQSNKIGERTKVEIRNVRGDIKDKLKKAIKDGLSEDNEKDAELDLQKLHDKYIKQAEELLSAKEKEIMTV